MCRIFASIYVSNYPICNREISNLSKFRLVQDEIPRFFKTRISAIWRYRGIPECMNKKLTAYNDWLENKRK